MIKKFIISLVLFLCNLVISENRERYIVPDVIVEAHKNGSFRAYIPDSPGLKNFAMHAKINEAIPAQDTGTIFMEVKEKTGDFWIAHFPDAHVKAGDRIYFWVFCQVDRYGFIRGDLNVTVSELLNEYPSLKSRCTIASTIANGKETCVGDTIIDEQFTQTTTISKNWIVEQWVPTYTPPSFVFNAYVNKDETRFVTNGILHLKPIAFQNDADVRGLLDLRNGCTSKVANECFVRSKAWFILPSVHSAKITSKTSFKYGKIDIKAKLPAGEWLVPVIRLEQKNKENGESSPVIWIAYGRGNKQLIGNGEDVGAHMLFGGPVIYQTEPNRQQHLVSKHAPEPFYDAFHKYSLEWKPGKMTFEIDDVEYGSVDLTKSLADDVDLRGIWSAPEAPFNKEYVISLGVAVGGLTDFPDGYISGDNPKPWSNTEPKFFKQFFDQRSTWSNSWVGDNAALQVEYVKVLAV